MAKDKKSKAAEKKARTAAKQTKKATQKEKKVKSKGADDSDAEDVDLETVLAEYAKKVSYPTRCVVFYLFRSKSNSSKFPRRLVSLPVPAPPRHSSGHHLMGKSCSFSVGSSTMGPLPPSSTISSYITLIKMNGEKLQARTVLFLEADMLGVEEVMQAVSTSLVANSPRQSREHSTITMTSGG